VGEALLDGSERFNNDLAQIDHIPNAIDEGERYHRGARRVRFDFCSRRGATTFRDDSNSR